MSIITFDLNLNHLYFLLISIAFIVRQILLKYIYSYKNINDKKESYNYFFEIFINTLSNLFAGFFICISKARTKSEKKGSDKQINNINSIQLIYSDNYLPINLKVIFSRTFLIAISDLIAQFSFFLVDFLKDIDLEIKKKMYSLLIFKILFNYFFSRILLKTYFYIHHYLSLIINIICLIFLISIDTFNIIKDKNPIFDSLIYILAFLFASISFSFENSIGKKALMQQYLNPYFIIFSRGLYESILLIIFSIPFFFIKDENNKTIFSSFINKINEFEKILLFILLGIATFIYNVFIWIIIDKFSPNHFAMTQIIEALSRKIILYNEIGKNLLFSIIEIIICFVLIIGSFIHNEILVLNFCGLNKYTQREFIKKSEEDFNQANEGIEYLLSDDI